MNNREGTQNEKKKKKKSVNITFTVHVTRQFTPKEDCEKMDLNELDYKTLELD